MKHKPIITGNHIEGYTLTYVGLTQEEAKEFAAKTGIELDFDGMIQDPKTREALEEVHGYLTKRNKEGYIQKLQAVKTMKDLTGDGLKDSKDDADILAENPHENYITFWLTNFPKIRSNNLRNLVIRAFSSTEQRDHRGAIVAKTTGII